MKVLAWKANGERRHGDIPPLLPPVDTPLLKFLTLLLELEKEYFLMSLLGERPTCREQDEEASGKAMGTL